MSMYFDEIGWSGQVQVKIQSIWSKEYCASCVYMYIGKPQRKMRLHKMHILHWENILSIEVIFIWIFTHTTIRFLFAIEHDAHACILCARTHELDLQLSLAHNFYAFNSYPYFFFLRSCDVLLLLWWHLFLWNRTKVTTDANNHNAISYGERRE